MGKAKQILEFYGLPGAGKSTICDGILNTEGISAAKVSDVMKHYHNESLFFKVIHFPVMIMLRLFLFLILASKKGNGKDAYIEFFYLSLSYDYFNYQNKYKYMIVDHGLIQQLGSFLHNSEFQTSALSLKLFRSFLSGIELLTIVDCRISETDALVRIKKRGRISGRIDAVIEQTDEALNLLKKENKLFEDVVSPHPSNFITLDMLKSREELLMEITQIITQGIESTSK